MTTESVPDCTLIGASDDLAGVACPIGRGEVMVGRSLEAVLRLQSDGVSRFHARIERTQEGTLVLSDLGSSNGTYVNGRRVKEPESLNDGDRIQFGPEAAFFVRYGSDGGPDTIEVRQPTHSETTVELLAKRSQARILLSRLEFEAALPLFLEVLDALDAAAHGSLAASEDIAELLTEVARCHVGLDSAADAVPLCRRAAALLLRSSAGSAALVRANFMLGKALFGEAPELARRIVKEAVESLAPGVALRQEVEAWLAVAGPA
ncbi:MAG: FHA domain-containing protein [Nannocystaceae bacterium]|nr:FHA domain-containing protein [Nannocystaceae bacterium]